MKTTKRYPSDPEVSAMLRALCLRLGRLDDAAAFWMGIYDSRGQWRIVRVTEA